MITKGYNMESINHQDRLLNVYNNEYGFSFKSKEDFNAFRTSSHPRNVVNSKNKGGKR